MLYDLKYYIEASNENVYHQVTQILMWPFLDDAYTKLIRLDTLRQRGSSTHTMGHLPLILE